MADGAVIRTGGRNVKDVAGYSLTHLFVGSQGTLAITTEATLELRPAPPPRLDDAGLLPDPRRRRGRRRRDRGRRALAGDARAARPVHDRGRRRHERPRPRPDGGRDADDRIGHAGGRGGRRAGAGRGRLPAAPGRPTSSGPPTRRRPTGCARRGGRRTTPSSGSATSGWRTSGCRARGSRTCSARSSGSPAKHDVRIGTFGHAGDGNLHPDLVFERGDPRRRGEDRGRQEATSTRRPSTSAGRSPASTASGWPGATGSRRQRGADAVRVMRAIKTALDPPGILNPGRVL